MIIDKKIRGHQYTFKVDLKINSLIVFRDKKQLGDYDAFIDDKFSLSVGKNVWVVTRDDYNYYDHKKNLINELTASKIIISAAQKKFTQAELKRIRKNASKKTIDMKYDSKTINDFLGYKKSSIIGKIIHEGSELKKIKIMRAPLHPRHCKIVLYENGSQKTLKGLLSCNLTLKGLESSILRYTMDCITSFFLPSNITFTFVWRK